ncbi:MAG: hypothetical protein IJW29_03530 [Clostridia bacterium]|nr:hypothetical protein [Clostridia bacterium]
MKRTFQRIAGVLACIALLVSAMPVLSQALGDGFDGESQPLAPGTFVCRIARDGLATLPNAEALLYAYDQIVAGVEVCAEEISIKSDYGKLSTDDVALVADAYRRDHAEHFWIGSTYTMRGTTDAVTVYVPSYELSGEALADARVAFNNAVEAFLDGITFDMSEYDRELLLHDRLASHVTYDLGAPNAHNAYGALVEGRAVCEGYAEALQVLLHRAWIESVLVFGSSVNPSTGSPEGHAWNMVEIDGKYYHVDLTWNDQETNTYHAYFNLTDAMIAEDHTVDPTPYALPACEATDAFYFNVGGYKLTDYTVESIAAYLERHDLRANFYIENNSASFIEWFANNVSAIAGELGVRGAFRYGYTHLGHEWVIWIDACLHRSMTYVPANPVGCETDGNRAYYTCTCGKWFEDAAAKSEIVDRNSVTLRALGHTFTEKQEDAAHLRASAVDCREHDTYWYDCSKCDTVSADRYFEGAGRGAHVFPLTAVPELTPTCDKAGKEAHYVCACGDGFEDAEGRIPITDLDAYGVIAATGHKDADGDEVCDVCEGGMKEDRIYEVNFLFIGGGALLLLLLIVLIVKRARR